MIKLEAFVSLNGITPNPNGDIEIVLERRDKKISILVPADLFEDSEYQTDAPYGLNMVFCGKHYQ